MSDSYLSGVIAIWCLSLGGLGLIVLAFACDKWLGFLALCVLLIVVGWAFANMSIDFAKEEEAAKKEQNERAP